MCSEIPARFRFARISPWLVSLFVMGLAALLWLPRLTLGALRHWDEAWYAEVSREMLRRSEWLTVYWNDAPWFHKPPLTFWGSMFFFHFFGESEVTARLFAFGSGLLLVGLITIVAARRFGLTTGLIAGLLLASLPEFARYANRGQLDAPLALFVSAQLLVFWHALSRPRLHLVEGLFFGLALMTKGAAAGLAAVVEASYILLARDFRPLTRPSWWLGWLLGIALALPWHLHQVALHGQNFARDYFDRHLAQFFWDIYPETSAPAASPWYYLDFLVRKEAAWGIVVLVLWLVATLHVVRKRERWLIFTWVWTTSIPLALSFAWAKWSWYLVPMYPGFALLVASLVPTLRPVSPRAPRYLFMATLLVAAISGLEGLTTWPNKEHEEVIRELAPTVWREVAPTGAIVTLQVGRARQSVYPIATRYYADRHVIAARSLQQLAELASNAGNVVYALAHADHLPELERLGKATGDKKGFEMETVSRAQNIAFLRLIPSWLAEDVRQAARKKAASR